MGATSFSNTNVVIGNRPITDLNLTHHKKAIRVLKTLVNQITLHQSQGTPTFFQASVATKYSPFAVTYPIFPKPNGVVHAWVGQKHLNCYIFKCF